MMAAYVIEKLNNTNYQSWASDMKYLLMEKDLWNIVMKNEEKPAEKDKSREFITRSNQALSILYLHVNPELKRIIENCNDPGEAWTKIKSNFCPDSRSNHMRLFSDLIECKIKVNETINLYASRLLRIYNDILHIDQNFGEQYLSFQILRYLPRRFDSIVQSILRWKSDDFIFIKITEELVAEETRLKVRDHDLNRQNCDINQVTAKGYSKPGWKKQYGCWICGSTNHIKRDCKRNFANNPGFRRRSNSRGSRNFSNFADVPFRARSPSPRSSSKDSSTCSRDSFRPFNRSSPSRRPHQSQWRPRDASFQNLDRSRSRRKSGKDGSYRHNDYNFHDSCKFSSNVCNYFISSYYLDNSSLENTWILDTGATHHFCSNRSLFVNFEPIDNKNMHVAIKDVSFPIEGRGDVKLLFGQRLLTLTDVMFSSKLKRNLISGPQLDLKGAHFHGGKRKVTVSRHNSILFTAYFKNGLYQIYPKVPKTGNHVTFANLTVSEQKLIDWHRKFSHISPSVLEHTCNENGARGLPNLKFKDFECEVCKINKHRKVSFKPLNNIRSKFPLDLLFVDAWGPAQVEGRNGERYFLSVIDDYSRRVSLYPMRFKSDAYEVLTNHITRAENFLNRKVKSVRSDNGGEFISNDLASFFKTKGIHHEFTNTFTPQQNGVAERFMQTVADGARTILAESNLNLNLWPEAMKYFVYTWNRVCPKSLNKTPFELYGGNKPSVKHLKPFGSLAFVGIPKQRRYGKLGPKARRGYLVGYAFRTRGYRIYSPETDQIIESSDVSFSKNLSNDSERSGAVMGPEVTDLFPTNAGLPNDVVEHIPEASRPGPSNRNRGESESQSGGETSDSESITDGSSPSPPISSLREVSWRRVPVTRKTGDRTDIYYYEVGKTKRLRSLYEVERYCNSYNIKFSPNIFDFKGANKYTGIVPIQPDIHSSDDNSENETDNESEDSNFVSANLTDAIVVPRTYNQAMKSLQRDKWLEAMQSEIDVMHERKVWHLATLPADITPVGCRWVYAVKRDEKGKIARFKARLVAQGFKQIKGESYDMTFSPVVNFGVIRFFFSLLVSCCGWRHIQCDVTSAYLYAPLKENVFMSQPKGFVVSHKENYFCKLDRALYGLHQSGREWFYEIHHVLLELGFVKLEACNCVYIFKNNIVLLLYVDDMVIFGVNQKLIDSVLSLLKSKFDIKILGKTRKLLGVEFDEEGGELEIFQTTYIDEVCERFKSHKIPLSSLPISKSVVYSKADCPDSNSEINTMSKYPYRSILGCLSFIANRTRPDIAYAVNIFSQFQANPGFVHWEGLLRLLGYVKQTREYRLRLLCNQECVNAFSDADFAANRDDRTSIGGNLVLLDNSPVDWRTFKEKCVSLSTMESEFVAMTEATKSLIWYNRVRQECVQRGIISEKCQNPRLNMDNQAAIEFVKSPIENHRSKHIDVKLHFVRDLVYRNEFELEYVKSKNNLADVFTKPLTKFDLSRFIDVFFKRG